MNVQFKPQTTLRFLLRNSDSLPISACGNHCRDVILPALGVHHGTDWDFGVFSGIEGVGKPNPRIYELALERAGNLSLDEVLHIGDSSKDYVPATALGCMHYYWIGSRHLMPMSGGNLAQLSFPDLEAAKEWLTSEKSAS